VDAIMHDSLRSDLVKSFNWQRVGRARYLAAVVLVLQTVVIGVIFTWERASRRADQEEVAASLKEGNRWSENLAKPIIRPRVVDAQKATLRSEEEVVGVEVGGKTRAYRLSEFEHPSGHLVNDLIGGVPVSVAYCNLSDCLRVYTDDKGSEPLGIEVAGRYDSKMVLRVGGILYFHESGAPVEPREGRSAIPYKPLTPTRTTWKDWVRQHPETEVYEGDRRPSDRKT
jgi:hypothetical protein